LTTDGRLSSLNVEGYGVKVFVLQSNLQALSPVVTNVVPAHDARVLGSNAVLRLQFSEPMNEAVVKGAFCYDGQPVAPAALSWNSSTRELTFSNSITDGIHVIEVTTNALSTAGLNLFGKFRSRFLAGSDSNILVNRAATNDLALVNSGAPIVTSTNVTLYHKAIGAQKYRARNESNAWSTWQTVAPTTAWTLSPGNGAKTVQVQYWADGSAAYFVTGAAALQEDWRISALAGQAEKVVTWPSISNRLYTVTWSSNAVGPWSAIATDLAPTPPQNAYTDTVHAAASPAFYRVSVRLP
jgi:hypothetical protein